MLGMTMIQREQLVEMFESSRANPNVRWSIDDVCLWSFFFTDHDRAKLLRAAAELEKQGYTAAGFLEPTEDDTDQGLLFLQVEREERHTVQSLHARNTQLYEFAEKFGLESYDGMDVGPLEGTHAQQSLQADAAAQRGLS